MDDRNDRILRTAALVFAAGFVVHNADHMRRGFDVVTDEVILAGTLVAMIAAVTLTLVFTRHPLAPLAAGASGFAIAVGVSLSHLVPEWSSLSDALPGGDVDAFTWIAVLAEVLGALAMGAAGVYVMQQVKAHRHSTTLTNA
jgi:hypothetical protein